MCRVSDSLVSPVSSPTPADSLYFFAVAVVVVVTNLPVNFAVDLAGAMRQGRKHLFHLARTHKQADVHTHTHTQQGKGGSEGEKQTKRREELRKLLATFLAYLFLVPFLGTQCRCTLTPLPYPYPSRSLLLLLCFLPHALCIFLSVKFNFHIE